MARWTSCNILQFAADARRLWQFDAKGGGFVLNREQRVPAAEPLPQKFIAKNWSSLWQPKLNVAWLPPEKVFLRVIELPASNPEEIVSMVEFQLEKLSPLPLAQIVWTFHVLPRPLEATGNLSTVVVVFVSRTLVEDLLGRLERDGFQADRLEVPMVDQLETVPAAQGGAWVFPQVLNGQSAALIAWFGAGTLRHLSLVMLPPAGDRTQDLKNQIAHTTWAGELEGWLTEPPAWNVVAEPALAIEWETLLRSVVSEPVKIVPPPPAVELAARTARRAAAADKTGLLPEDYTTRYQNQFYDRLWLRGLGYAGVVYAVCVVIYFCAVAALGYKTGGVENQVAALSGSYTNSLQLTARNQVLLERQQLKYAALDCWKVVAEQLPTTVTLQRFSFSDGQRLVLTGTAPQDQVNTLFDFNTAMLKLKQNGQIMFNQVDPINPRFAGGIESWNLGLQLIHAEADSR
jgi:hypothetical protein